MQNGHVLRARWVAWVAIVACVVFFTDAKADSATGGGRAAWWSLSFIMGGAGLLWLLVPRRLWGPDGIRLPLQRIRGSVSLPWTDVGGLEVSRRCGWRRLRVMAVRSDGGEPGLTVWEPLVRGPLEDVVAFMGDRVPSAVTYSNAGARSPRRPVWAWAQVCFGVAVLIAIVSVGVFLPVYVHRPASTEVAEARVRVSGRPAGSIPSGGAILILGTANRQAHPFDLVRPFFDDVTIGPNGESAFPRVAAEHAGRQDASNSAASARYAALVRAGRAPTISGSGVEVAGVAKAGPAHGHLRTGDVITGAAATEVRYAEDLDALLQAAAPGTRIALEVMGPAGAMRQESVVLTGRSLGIRFVTTRLEVTGADDVELSVADFSGPSAGLALGLAVLDVLGEGGVTRGRVVAVTGSLSPDGIVGRVGGIPLKIAAAVRANAGLLLVPGSQVDEARRAAPDRLTVVGVGTLDEALAALAR